MNRENLLFIGVDLHKAEHTAVLVNCWNEWLETVTIENKPSDFPKLTKLVNKRAKALGVSPVYGLENAYGYGRSLAVWLVEQGYCVKDVNSALAHSQRKSAPTFEKNDEHDAYAVATVMINQLHKLPDVKPDNAYWTLAQLDARREALVVDGTRLKNGLHEQLFVPYPSYKKFFGDIDGKVAMYFWKTYPSPVHLQGKTAEELLREFKTVVRSTKKDKARLILEYVGNDGDTHKDFQEARDFITQSLARSLEQQQAELQFVESEIERMLTNFEHKLTTLPHVGATTACKLISEIGDISRFRSSNALARYVGAAPANFSSAGKGKDVSSTQGNRRLNGIFHFMAVGAVGLQPGSKKPYYPVFREYFERKVSEGKTGAQAIVCVMRRLVTIVYSMMKTNTEYRPYKSNEE